MKPGTREYQTLHEYMRTHRGPAMLHLCEGCCGGQARDWANVHGTEEYVPLCVPCHRQYDFGICPHGHDTVKFGRTPSHECRVCNRLDSAQRKGVSDSCQVCGFARCKCQENR